MSEEKATTGGCQVDTMVMRLRKRYGLAEDIATDQEVFDATSGTLGRALLELDIASEALGGVLRDDISETRKRMQARISLFLCWIRSV